MSNTPGVIFDEPSHTYKSTLNNKKYISCTTLIGKYKQPFDKQAVAEAYARKHNRTVADVLEEWDKTRDDACLHGTAFHAKQENKILADKGQSILYPTDPFYIHGRPFPDYANLPDGVEPEMLLWDHYWGIAGTADKPIFDGEYFDVQDFKTNKQIDMVSYCAKPYYNRVLRKHMPGGYKMMLFPLNHIQDCNYRHYELQLSLYAYMIERLTGKKARNLTILHHPRNRETNEIPEVAVEYPCSYRKEDVELMLQHYFKKPLPE